MDPAQIQDGLAGLLDRDLYRLGDEVVALWRVLAAALVLLAGWLAAHRLRRTAGRIFHPQSEEEAGTNAVVEPLAFWAAAAAIAVLVLDLLGVDVATLRGMVDAPILTVSGTPVTLVTVVTVVFITTTAWLLSRILRNWAAGALRARGVDAGTQGITKRLIHYSVMAVGLAIALDNLGVNLAALFAAGAVLAVGLGFAMQNIAQNFVSGLILLIERTIKPGDVLEVEGSVVVVERMGIRTTVARTRDEEEIIIPNATLVQNSVKNYTLQDSLYRIRARVGVAYASDLRRVQETLHEAAESLEWRFAGKEPLVFLKSFGESAVEFEASVWIDDPWSAERLRSDFMQVVWEALHDAGITIPLAQMDVHFDTSFEEAVGRLPRAS